MKTSPFRIFPADYRAINGLTIPAGTLAKVGTQTRHDTHAILRRPDSKVLEAWTFPRHVFHAFTSPTIQKF